MFFFHPSKFASGETKNRRGEKNIFIFEKSLDFCNLLWYCCVLTGGTAYEKHY